MEYLKVPEINKKKLLKLLTGELPGEKAQLKMAPEFRGNFIFRESPRPAAVMILLFPYKKELHTLFIKRNEYPGPHSAQISFPGGLYEPDDGKLMNTAIRETVEETGIRNKIDVLGSLTPLFIPVSNFIVTPFIGWVRDSPDFTPDPSEVQYLIHVPFSDLFDSGCICSEKIKRHDIEFIAPYYALNGEKIWGATAMMLSEFLELVGRKQ